VVKVEAEDAGKAALALFSAAAPLPSSRNLEFHISSSSSIKLVLEIFRLSTVIDYRNHSTLHIARTPRAARGTK
jgi:hypothetical protein